MLLNVCLGVVSHISVLASEKISLRLCEWIFLQCCLLMFCCLIASYIEKRWFSTLCYYNLFSVSL